MIAGQKSALASLKLAVSLLRLCSLLALVILYYFSIIQWVYVSAASTDGREYSIRVMNSD
ncbi:MAG: hypothetical protein Q9M92_04155 [Enterobacterales bacterium]|nr:hypothetical protein [Enterobacterales bacterium]